MRISNSVIQQTVTNLKGTASEPMKPDTALAHTGKPAVHLGDVLTGLVVQVKEGQLVLKFGSDQLLTLAGRFEGAVTPNETVSVEITQTEPELAAKLTSEGPVQKNKPEALQGQFKEILVKLGLPITENNLKAVALLREYHIEPNSDSIKTLVDGSISASKMSQSNSADLEQLDLSLTIKQAFVQWTKTGQSAEASAIRHQMATSNVATQEGGKVPEMKSDLRPVLMSEVSAGSITVSAPDKSSESAEIITATDLPVETDVETSIGSSEKRSVLPEVKSNETPHLKNNLIQALSSFDMEKAAVLFKTGIPLTLKNVLQAEQVLFGTASLSKTFEQLITVGDRMPLSELTSQLEQMLHDIVNDDDLSIDGQLKQLDRLINASEQLEKGVELKEILLEMKSSMTFVKEVNENLTFIQFPIQMEDQLTQVNLFMKKRNKSGRSESMKLLIALNTEKTGLVQAFIDWEPERVQLTFRLENESIQSLYESELEGFQELLENLLGKPVKLSATLSTKKIPIQELLSNEPPVKGLLDIKV